MRASLGKEKKAIAFLNSIPKRYDSLISLLEALGNEKQLTFELIKAFSCKKIVYSVDLSPLYLCRSHHDTKPVVWLDLRINKM